MQQLIAQMHTFVWSKTSHSRNDKHVCGLISNTFLTLSRSDNAIVMEMPDMFHYLYATMHSIDKLLGLAYLNYRAMRNLVTGTREPGAVTTWKLWGRRPLNFGLSMSFIFLFFLECELGSLPKIVGRIRGVFSSG